MDDELRMECRPTKTLPEGYLWIHWTDGSGYLRHPDGTSSFEYDLNPYYGQGVEYQKNNQWSVFWGSFDDFIAFAEHETMERLK